MTRNAACQFGSCPKASLTPMYHMVGALGCVKPDAETTTRIIKSFYLPFPVSLPQPQEHRVGLSMWVKEMERNCT